MKCNEIYRPQSELNEFSIKNKIPTWEDNIALQMRVLAILHLLFLFEFLPCN